ncbi:hypothetical protein BDZ94DRAFT_1323197 [Collybia nuda]|uniref:Zn(2)-C6 fungal-type domain-containing protein n=1 Tax=Collybia nuda TaxID=64659 RepID=A0A9P5Y3H4_9AGAR|nr:hypothetical protein BDZ94DRAFT_1323197 [Collybia nuda]
MSSNEEDYDGDGQQGSKKRRIQRACDICRRKKIRCDGVQMPGNRCSNCIAYSFDCTYVEAAKKRGPPKGYVESLEIRLEKLEKLLRKICPDEDFLKDLHANLDNDKWITDKMVRSRKPSNGTSHSHSPLPLTTGTMQPPTPQELATSIIRRVGSPVPNTDNFPDDDFAHISLSDNLKRMSLDPKLDLDMRFFGKSSGAMFVQTAIELKNEYIGSDQPDLRRPVLGNKRPEFWTVRSWEGRTHFVDRPVYKFPEEDLLKALIELYFKHSNLYIPLLHRPTFENSIAEGLHLKNDMFGATVLLVCAVASRYSDDPRILLDGVDSYHSCGWKWFDQHPHYSIYNTTVYVLGHPHLSIKT